MLTTVQSIDMGVQALKDALSWHTGPGHNLSKDALSGFSAGFQEGYRAAREDIKRHGGIETNKAFRARLSA